EITHLIEHIGDPAGHASGKIPARPAEHHHAATRHVLAAMVPHSFDHSPHAAITDTETLTSHTTDIGFSLGGAIKGYVAKHDVFSRHKGGTGRRIENDPAARQPLTKIIVGIPLQFQGDALGYKRPKTLPSRALEMQMDGARG